MRGLVGLVALCTILPSASAVFLLAVVQEVRVEDSIGDATINGVPADHLDITDVALSIEENSMLVVDMGLVDAAMAQDLSNTRLSAAYYWVELDYHGERFDVVWNHDLSRFIDEEDVIIDQTAAKLMRDDPSGWTLIANEPATTDRDDSRLIARFDLNSFVDSKGFNPGPGERIGVLAARSYFNSGIDPKGGEPGGVSAFTNGAAFGTDDAEFPEGTFLDIIGEASETIGLGTSNPIRFSNGEATTYHWPVRVVNHEDTPMDLLVELEADSSFEVYAPQTLQVPAGGEAIADIYASAPFAHKHGESRYLTVHLTSEDIEATLDLAVHYLDVPQPSGHHPVAYMHAYNPGGGQPGYRWMDTIEEPVRDAHDIMEFGNAFCGSEDTDSGLGDGLVFSLAPALMVGIDARIDETIQFTATMDHQVFRPAGQIMAALIPYDRVATQDVNDLADRSMPHSFGFQSLPQALTGEQVNIDMEVPVPHELDLVAPGSTMNLAFVVMYCADDEAQNNARNAALTDETRTTLQDAEIFLPFDDYHDLVNIDLDRGIELSVDQSSRSAAPGAQILWNIKVTGEGDGEIQVTVIGSGADWATVHGGGHHIGDTVPVSATIPPDAINGAKDIIVEITDVEDMTRRAAVRLILDVDPTAQDDDAARIDALKDIETRNTPVGAALLPTGLLVAALIARHRRP